MIILDINPSSQLALLVHICLFIGTSVLSAMMIYWFFFVPDKAEQDQYYLRGNVTKMVHLVDTRRNVGGRYFLYKLKLHDEKTTLGANMQKIIINFDYVSDQEIIYDPSKAGRYPVEKLGQTGFFEIIEREDSDIDKILRRNLNRDKPFELSVKGPYGRFRYLGDSSFFE